MTQKSRRMLGARSCSSLVLPVGVTYSRYTVHSWDRMKEWNSEHLQSLVFFCDQLFGTQTYMCTTLVLLCSANPAKMTWIEISNACSHASS